LFVGLGFKFVALLVPFSLLEARNCKFLLSSSNMNTCGAEKCVGDDDIQIMDEGWDCFLGK